MKARLLRFFRLFAQSLLTSSYGNNAYTCLSIIRLDSDAHFAAGVREEKEKNSREPKRFTAVSDCEKNGGRLIRHVRRNKRRQIPPQNLRSSLWRGVFPTQKPAGFIPVDPVQTSLCGGFFAARM